MKYLFPEGKYKAVTFSFDDGQIFDRKLVEMFNRYGLKGTFNLNSGRMGTGPYVSATEIKSLYHGHEIASHSVSHPFLTDLSTGDLIKEILKDRETLENLCETTVTGFAYPFGMFNQQIASVLESLGIEYARTVTNSTFFTAPADFMEWNPGMHYRQAFSNKQIDRFLLSDPDRDPQILYIWGHSYELEQNHEWLAMEELCKKVSAHSNIWYCTNRELCRYVKAVRSVRQNVSGSIIENLSSQPIWIENNHTVTRI